MAEKVNVHYPEYFPGFHCIGSACEDTCCAGWQIGADPAALRRYRKEKGPFKKKLRAGMNLRTGAFSMKNGTCPFLNEEKLCEMYIHMGKESLCKTCREFPRHVEDYGILREIGLSMACPEAARRILSGEGTDLRMKTKEVISAEPVEEDGFLDFLLKLRDVFFYLLNYGTVPGQKEAPPMRLKAAMILALARDVQKRMEKGEEWPENLLGRYTKAGAFEKFAGRLENYFLDEVHRTGNGLELKAVPGIEQKIRPLILQYLERIETLDAVSVPWRHLVRECKEWLRSAQDTELSSTEDFLDDKMLGSLMHYYLYTWFLGSVYDEEPYVQVKMAVISCILVEIICRYLWDGKEDKKELLVHTAHLWARELEHSDENLGQLEEMLKEEPAFEFDRLLWCMMF